MQEVVAIPRLGLGTWKSPSGRVGRAVREALAIGYRHIDCAPIYGNEAEIGAALEEWQSSGGRREDLWISSKLWNDAHFPDAVRPALEKTLHDLRLDCLDLYLIHWPVHYRRGVGVPRSAADYLPPDAVSLAETWQAMEDCVRAGLARHIGVCNFCLPRLAAFCETAAIKPAALQIELHPWLPQTEMLDFCRERGIIPIAFAPLGSGDRPRALKLPDEPVLLADAVIRDIARKHRATPAQILLAWALGRGTAVIPKSVSPRHLRENFAAGNLRLDAEDMARITALECGRRLLSGNHGASPYTQEWLWNHE